jgi:16S rRNA (guanine966-N2)-methyltransferase
MAALAPRLSGAHVLDLFAGSGALGLEALSRGAEEVVFVERARSALAVLRANIELLEAQAECRVVPANAMTYVESLEADAFDLVLADPPYDQGFAGELLRLFEKKRFARELWVEHRSAEIVPEIAGLRQRRYGDTTLSILEASR